MTSDDGKRYVSVRIVGYSLPYSYKERHRIRNMTSDESADPEVVSDHTGISLSSVKKRVASLKDLGMLVKEVRTGTAPGR